MLNKMSEESKFVNLRRRKQASDEEKARDRDMKCLKFIESERGSVKKEEVSKNYVSQ